MPNGCDTCRRLKAAYELLESEPRRGRTALDKILGPYLRHLSEAEAEAYGTTAELPVHEKPGSEPAAEAFLAAYETALRQALEKRGCDIAFAIAETRSWLPCKGQDYTALRIGLSMIARSEAKAAKPERQALTA
jgi:hypothetical protein